MPDLNEYPTPIQSDLAKSVYDNLMIDIGITDGSEVKLAVKVANAEKEVKRLRRYPSGADEEYVDSDMEQFWTVVYNLALYDYNQRGAEGEESINENGEYRVFIDRNKILSGVNPIVRLV